MKERDLRDSAPSGGRGPVEGSSSSDSVPTPAADCGGTGDVLIGSIERTFVGATKGNGVRRMLVWIEKGGKYRHPTVRLSHAYYDRNSGRWKRYGSGFPFSSLYLTELSQLLAQAGAVARGEKTPLLQPEDIDLTRRGELS